MYKKGSKICSTPLNEGSGNTTISVSDIKGSLSDDAIKIKRRNLIESQQSDSEWETQSSWTDNSNKKDEAAPNLFESLERVQDLEVEREHVLSPPLIINQRGRNDSSTIEDKRNDKDNDTDRDNILPVPSESKKLCGIKRGCSSRKRSFPALIQERVYVPYNDDELLSKLAANKFTGRMGKWITKETKSNDIPIAKKSKYDGIWSGVTWKVSQEDFDLFDENNKRITFNEFHATSKLKNSIKTFKKEIRDTGWLWQGPSRVAIQSIKKINVVVYKRADRNFGIIKN